MPVAPASFLLKIAQDFKDHRARRADSWYGYSEKETWGAIPFAVHRLFRGQNERYPTMLPSIARGLSMTDIPVLWSAPIPDQAKFVLRMAQAWWFSRELRHHPIADHARKQGLDLDEIALAQHYEIPTGYLDLSDDFNVSAFFATCSKVGDTWEPVDTEAKKPGVIYRVELKTHDMPFGRYVPVGPQQLPRPSEQCAWVAELPLGPSFENWPDVSFLEFKHDRRVGEHFLEMFDGGHKLFPPDPLADVATHILKSHEIPKDFVEAVLASFDGEPTGLSAKDFPAIRQEMSKMTTQVDYQRILTDQHIASLLADDAWKERMLSEVRVRWMAIRRTPVAPGDVNPLTISGDIG
jgi:hypothetical protein